MNRFGIGQAVKRVEDRRFLAGEGRFAGDIDLPRQCHGAVVMSPHPHAIIRRVDVSKATATQGVVCVLTGADVVAEGIGSLPTRMQPEALGFPTGYTPGRPVLVADRVRCVGDRVAFVVAETAEQARDAAERIEIDYETLPSVVNIEDAAKEGAPRVWDDCPGNVAVRIGYGDAKAVDAAFAAARHVVSLRLNANRLSANTLEPRASLGEYNAAEDSYTLYHSSQNPHGARTILAGDVFRVPEARMRVIAPDVGGGFGMKSAPYPEDALVLWASRRCGRPVKWVCTRSEALMGDSHARDQVVQGEMALDESGKISAIRAQALQAVGAYATGTLAPIEFAVRLIPNVYDVQTLFVVAQGVLTHTSPLTSYRGAGRPEAITLVERLLDRAAQRIGLSPLEIRRRNFIAPKAMPYKTATGLVYDSGEFARVMDKCLQLAGWNGFAARRSASEKTGLLRGRAVSYYLEYGGRMNDRMELRCDPGGAVTIVAGTHSHGQGHATTYAQMVSDWLGVPFDSIRFVQGDTDKVLYGRGSFAARASMIGGCALLAAARTLVEKAKPMAADLLETAPADISFSEGAFRIAGTDRALRFADVARAFYRPLGLPPRFGLGLEASGTYAAEPPNYPNGCHACEVEVDPETGVVKVDRYTVVDDLGKVINPMICEGQIHGGLAQGIGQSLMEHLIYDRDSGQLLSGSFTDYCMPRADDFPAFSVGYEEVPCRTNPLGIKGVGEAGAVASPPTVINAILDALHPLGVAHIDMPATPERVWASIQAAKAASLDPAAKSEVGDAPGVIGQRCASSSSSGYPAAQPQSD